MSRLKPLALFELSPWGYLNWFKLRRLLEKFVEFRFWYRARVRFVFVQRSHILACCAWLWGRFRASLLCASESICEFASIYVCGCLCVQNASVSDFACLWWFSLSSFALSSLGRLFSRCWDRRDVGNVACPPLWWPSCTSKQWICSSSNRWLS